MDFKKANFKDTIFAIDFNKIPDGTYVTGLYDASNNNLKRLHKPFFGVVTTIQKEKIILVNVGVNEVDHNTNWSGATVVGHAGIMHVGKKEWWDKIVLHKTIPAGYSVPDPIFLINDKKVEFRKGEIKIGCTTVKNSTIKEIVKHLKN